MLHRCATVLIGILSLSSAAGQETAPPAPPANSAKSLPKLDEPATLTVDSNGSATAVLTLRFAGKPTEPLRLWLGDFQHQPPKGTPYPIHTTAVFAPINDADKPIVDGTAIPPADKPLAFKLTVTGLWQSGTSTATLRNGGSTVATLTALRIPQAFNVAFDSPPSVTPEVLSSPDHKPTIKLVNTDAMTHQFAGAIRRNGTTKPLADPIVVPPSSFVLVDLTSAAPDATFLAAGTIKDNVVGAELLLTPVFPNAAVPELPTKVLPLSFRLRFWNDGIQQAVNVGLIFLILTLGGIVSILVNCGMPNTTRALAFRRRIKALKPRIAGLGDLIDSRWRVILSARRVALRDQLFSTLWVFPSFATVLDAIPKELEMVEQWVDITYKVSLIMQGVRQQLPKGFPPTLLDWVEDRCRAALEHIETGITTPEELQKMRDLVAEAAKWLDAAVSQAPIAELEEEIKKREAALTANRAALLAAFPTEFNQLVAQVTAALPAAAIPPAAYADRDTASRRLELLDAYRTLVERMTPAAVAAAAGVGAPPPPPGPAPSILGRMQANRERLLEHLRPESLASLRKADVTLLEIRQDIYDDTLLAESRKDPPALRITTLPADIACGLPVRLSVRFLRSDDLDGAAACREWQCEWDFGDGTPIECGFDVFHAFPGKQTYNVEVTIRDRDTGTELLKLPRKPVTVKDPSITFSTNRALRGIQQLWSYISPETVLEMSRLLLVLVVTVIGLIGAATKQIESMSLLAAASAIFALGFTADTFKTLVTQKATTADNPTNPKP